MNLEPAVIAKIIQVSESNIASNWPLIQAAMRKHDCYSDQSAIAAICTIRVEAPPFKPINEYGNAAYFTRMYEHRADLGNTQPGDGAQFHGRGYIQLTGRANYERYGALLGIDLVSNPDAALDPQHAAEIFALYWSERRIREAADARNWPKVRRLVNGGLNGYDTFCKFLGPLLRETGLQSLPVLGAP